MRNILIPGLLLANLAAAQSTSFELVSNGGFEFLNKPVQTFDQLDAAEGWSNATSGLSEVFDSTATAKTVGLPLNAYGTVKPKEGAHCAGFFAWKDDKRRTWEAGHAEPFQTGWSSYSEYLMTELTAPLEAGKEYTFSMDVMLAGTSDRAVSALGAYCSPVPLHHEHRRFLEEKAQVASEKVIDARGEWTRITGTFEADGGERYLIIGVYPYVGLEAKSMLEGPDNQYAYYYLDGVSLKRAEPRVEEQ